MSTETRRVLQHLRSEEEGKVPSAEQIELGEIAVNYNANEPFLTIKDNEGNLQKIPTAEVCYLPATVSCYTDKVYYYSPSEDAAIVYAKIDKAYKSHQVVMLGSSILQYFFQEYDSATTTNTYSLYAEVENVGTIYTITPTGNSATHYDYISDLKNTVKNLNELPLYKGTYGSSLRANSSDNVSSAGYSFAEGLATKASGFASHSEGNSTKASGKTSHAEGYYTNATGEASHAEGYYTSVSTQGGHAEGKYNEDDSNAIHTIGIGTLNADRKNSEIVYTDGRKYLYGIGGYDGTKASIASGATDVATVINNITASTENFITSAFTESNYIRKDAILSIDCGTY